MGKPIIYLTFADDRDDHLPLLTKERQEIYSALLPHRDANRIQLLTHPTVGLSSHNALRAVRFYAQLDSQSSRDAVAKWPKAKDPKITHQPQLEAGRAQRFVTDTNTSRDVLTQQPLEATG